MTDAASRTPEAHDLAIDTAGGRIDDTVSTTEQPLVTAVVTTYDRFSKATRAIESVLEQTYEPLELIVVEDGTDSGVRDWLTEAGYGDVRYVRHAANHGLSGARNTALALASGRHVAYLDDDDEWKPDRIARGVERFQRVPAPRCDRIAVVYCAVESREDGAVASIVSPENEGNLAEAIRRDGPSTLQSSFLFDREILASVGGFDESLRSSVDHDVWMALAVNSYEALTVDDPLVVARNEFADSMMTNTDARIEGVSQFVGKWRSTYHEWFGRTEGERRIQRYFARVVSRLAASKLVTGAFGEATRATRAVFTHSDQTVYNCRVLAVLTAEAAVKRFAPPVVVRHLSTLRRRLRRYDSSTPATSDD